MLSPLADKLYVVGGSDGCQSLCTTEVYDFESNSWSPGPSMTSCRANISVTVIHDRLYAVGGFTGIDMAVPTSIFDMIHYR